MSNLTETKASIPKDWEIKSLSEAITDSIGGGTPSTKVPDYWKGEIHWTTSKRLSEKMYLFDGEKRISKTAIEKTSTKIVPKGNLIISTRVTVGKAMVNMIEIAINQDLTGLVINKDLFSPEFIAYQIRTHRIQEIFESQKRGATIKGITREDLKKIALFCPLLLEQEKIARVLLLIQSAIETREKIIQTSTELKKTLMQKLFSEGLRNEPQKETEIGRLPKSWGVCPINDLVLDTETRNPKKESTKSIKYIDVSSVSNQTFSIVGHQNFLGKDAPGRARKVVCADDVIFATIRPTLRRVAKISPEYNNEYCSTAFCVLRADSKKLYFEFLYQYILTDTFISEIGRHQSGASYPAVRDDDVKKMKIPCPSFDEQREISGIFKSMDDKVNFAIKQISILQTLFKTMLHHLMTGQIRVKD